MSLLDGGIFGNGDRDNKGLLDFPGLSDIPGLPGLTSILHLPGPASSTSTSATTSVQQPTQSTTSLTLQSTTSLPTSTSATTSATSSAITSETASSGTTSTSQTSATDTAVTTPPSITPTSTTPPPTLSDAVSSSTSSTASETQTSPVADLAPQGFLANKPLSVGVITAASLVGLILLVVIATWAIRKRRHERLHQDILDFSNAGLVGSDLDPEKNADPGSTAGHGSGSSLGHGGTLPPPVQPRQMYQDNYAAPIYAPQQPPSRNANPYGAQPGYGATAYGGYQQNNSYDNWGYGNGYGNAAAMQNPYDQAYGGMDDAYGGYVEPGMTAGVGAGAQAAPPSNPPQRRPSAQRKAPPPLNLNPPNPIAQPTNAPSPVTAVSLNNPPLQPAAAPPVLPHQFGASPDTDEPRRLIVRNE